MDACESKKDALESPRMTFIVTVVHVFVSLFLMLTVLLQAGKGGGMGATFGGGSSQGSVFGGSGAGNFLSKLTTGSAVFFMATSMTLAYLASTSGEDSLKRASVQQRLNNKKKQQYDQEATSLIIDAGLMDEIDENAPDLPGTETDTSETSETDTSSTDAEGTEAPKSAEEPKAEEPKAEEPKAEEPKKAKKPKAEPKAEEPKAEEPKAEEPVETPSAP
jgi:preprotein translocase subunit SecG